MITPEEFLENKGWHKDAKIVGGALWRGMVDMLKEYTELVKESANVIPRYPDGGLFLKNGSRQVKMPGSYIAEKPVFTISCIEYWEAEDPDFGSPEEDHATYYPNLDEINEMIKALEEARYFINGGRDDNKRTM